MTPTKKTTEKKTGDEVAKTAVVSPLDEYETRPQAKRSAEDTAKAERRFGANQTEEDPNVAVEVPDITSADVERILAEAAEAEINAADLADRVEEIENSTAPLPIPEPGGSSFTDNVPPKE